MSDRKPCVRCGRTIDAAARLCPFCNWDQEAPVPAIDPNAASMAPAYVPPEETGWRKYVFGAVGGVVLVLLAFVVGAQLQRRKNVTPPVPKGSPAATDTAPAAHAPAPRTNVTLVPDNGPVTATTDQAYTSAPVSSTAQGLASQTDRADATAVSSSEYAQLAQRAAAEAAQQKKANALVDPRSITGQPYGSAPAPVQRRTAAATLAQQMPAMTSAAPPSMVPAAAPAPVMVGPVPERQPMPSLRLRENVSATIEVNVAPDGRVTDVNVLQPLPGDDTARLIAAVQNWHFKPATENGAPVASRFRTTLFFHAHGR